MGQRKTKKSHKIQLSPTFSDRVRDPYSFRERVSSACLPERSSRSGVVGKEAESAPYGRLGAVIDLSPFFLCDSAHLTDEGPIMGSATEIATGSDYLALIYQSLASSLSSSAPLRSQLRDDGRFWLEVRSRTRAWYRARTPPLVELSASG
ncbi:hypothetical protein U1Q18_037738, partial [Sarracenia purpurea var. burkii]